MNSWAAFWLVIAVLVVADYAVFKTGVDSLIWQYKTPPELAIQQAIIDKGKK